MLYSSIRYSVCLVPHYGLILITVLSPCETLRYFTKTVAIRLEKDTEKRNFTAAAPVSRAASCHGREVSYTVEDEMSQTSHQSLCYDSNHVYILKVELKYYFRLVKKYTSKHQVSLPNEGILTKMLNKWTKVRVKWVGHAWFLSYTSVKLFRYAKCLFYIGLIWLRTNDIYSSVLQILPHAWRKKHNTTHNSTHMIPAQIQQ